MDAAVAARPLDAAFRTHERLVWQLCYRMTGVAADADDLVQETFLRALERPPSGELRPWLVRVAVNLARDLLRRRRRRRYVGPWLPSPVEDDAEPVPAFEPDLPGGGTTEGRYDLVESASYAFLLALEALTPLQRAVLLLRDVFDYSVRETAGALGTSEGNVKVCHHRARRAMAAYDRARRPPTRDLARATRTALARFMSAVLGGDAAAAEACLTADVRATSDGGGEVFAARKVVVGAARVARMYGKLSRQPASRVFTLAVNGLPAIAFELDTGKPGQPTRGVIRIDLAPDGRIAAVHSILAPRKLAGVRWSAARQTSRTP